MQSRSIYEYYFFGTCVRYLEDAREGMFIVEDDDQGYVLDNLKMLFRYLDELDLQVTARAAHKLKEVEDELKKRQKGQKLTEADATQISELMNKLRMTLDAELMGFNAFIVTPKVIDVTKLLSKVPQLLGPSVFEKLPEIARHDLLEAAKCVAFERPTAAAFHLLRGTESVLRAFYCQLVKQKRVGQMWGPIVQHLQSKKRTTVHSDLLNHLDHIRRSFRNPTQHPEKIYDIHEVQDLWALCVDAINRMAKALPG